MTGAVHFCRRGAPALVAAIDIPVQLPAVVEVPHAAAPASLASVERVLAFVVEKCEACADKEDATACRACRGSGQTLKPLLVRSYEQLFAPRRWQLELHSWAHAKGTVT